MNVALYRAGHDRWAMTERGRSNLSRSQSSLKIGPSSVEWDGDTLRLDIDEWTAPLPSRVRGTVTLRPEVINERAFALDAEGKHYWRPIAPRARIDLRFDGGALAWSGDAYLDSNWGNEPLERGFRSWHWSRAHAPSGTQVYYDVEPRAGSNRSLALVFDKSGAVSEIEAPPYSSLPGTFWRVPRVTRGNAGAEPRLVRTLEDAPFYARSQLIGEIDGAQADIMHESLSLDRFRAPIVRAMLPFRMPRIVRRR